ncbi:chromate transporter [Gemmiger sp.]|uniref:chromate transporter n=1 Tax=Gemmiger sp. TaxID=2049027 RepID=UPI0025BC726F|nr:chromate transporter [Gemmiger sp.]
MRRANGGNAITDDLFELFLNILTDSSILLIASALKNLMKYAPVNAFLSGVRPCVVAMILATALSMALSTLFGLTDLQAGFAPDLRSIAVFAMLGATHLICKKIRKTAPSPILMILFSAGLGILFWCIF